MNGSLLGAGSVLQIEEIVARKLRDSMLWMVWGLVTTLATMVAMFFNPEWLSFSFEYYRYILFAELGVVILFSARQMSASLSALKAMFFAYAIMNGLTLTAITVAYGTDAVFYAFIGTLAFFVSFAAVGKYVSRDLSGFVPYLLAAVVAMILVGLGLMFFGLSSTWSLAMGCLGVVVFTIFTAVDVNIIKRNLTAAVFEDEDVLERIELIGALNLYLDFINLFLSLLRVFGRK